MSDELVFIENDVQDKDSLAWKKLCEYIDNLIVSGDDEFCPIEFLGRDLYSQIYTLPQSIAKLKKVKKIWLYGSKLKRIPPEIGEMEALEYFDPYTSYNLHWLPYEIINCQNLKDSRISTRALYGNYKFRNPFPDLSDNPVRYENSTVKCSICKKEMSYQETNQMWISLWIGTDVVPLLVNLCSENCKNKLPYPPKGHLKFPHKGGSTLIQKATQQERWEKKYKNQELTERTVEKVKDALESNSTDTEGDEGLTLDVSKLKSSKLVRKIWNK